jgi:glutamine amidotransferase
MCLLTFIPEYVTPDMERFAVAAQNNPDGFGFAILGKDKIYKEHGMNFKQVAEKFIDMRKTLQGPAIFHFRWATHGSETVDNCHPFSLGNDPMSVMGHNGILPVKIDKGDDRSDTKVFAQDIMPAIGGVTSLDDDEYFKKLEAWAKGSKLVFLTLNEDAKYPFYILNEKDGHWDKDIWWSNYSYEYSRYTYKPYTGMYSSTGWDNWDYGYESYSTQPKNQILIDDDNDEAQIEIDDMFNQFGVFMTALSKDESLLECYSCAHSEHVASDEIFTHCPQCFNCLHCGTSKDCMCWDALYENYYVDAYNHAHELETITTTHPSFY